MSATNEWDIKLNTRRELSCLQAAVYYPLYHQKAIHTNDDLFDDFPKISEHFPKILLRLSEGQTIVSEQFLKVTEDVRGRTDDVFIIQEHI